MGIDGDVCLARRRLAGWLVVGAVSCVTVRVALAQDPDNALRELAESPDFRVRVSAALYLGRARPAGARAALEHALGDLHPSVRGAAASALGTLGDRAAMGALSRRAVGEPSASVKAQLQSSMDQLRRHAPSDEARALGTDVRYVVCLGAMRNPSGVRGDELRRVLHDATQSRLHAIRGGAVLDTDGGLLAQAAQRKIPVLTLNGSLMQLTESGVEGGVQVRACVEFVVLREQTLKGTLSGAATTFGSGPALSDQGRRQLQDDAVDGAVQSALRGADQGLRIAAL